MTKQHEPTAETRSNVKALASVGKKQEERYATWEPSIDRPPSFRPDLVLLPYSE